MERLETYTVPPIYGYQTPEGEGIVWKNIFLLVAPLMFTIIMNYWRWKTMEWERKRANAGIDHYSDPEKRAETRELDDIEIMNKVKRGAPVGAEECGGVAEGYRWTQTEWEIDVKVDLEGNVDKRGVTVKVGEMTLEVAYKIGDGVEKVIMEGALWAEVDVPECGWSSEGSELWIRLRKKSETNGKGHWSYVVDDGHEIDVLKFGPIIEEVNMGGG